VLQLGVRHLPKACFQVSCKCLGLDDGLSIFAALNIALVGVLVSGANSNDPVGPWHLDLELVVVRDSHELHIAWSS
jgi:hypothetical protein